jgi:hypothetical protein
MMDGFAHLLFKVFQYADRGQAQGYSGENLYAPFYLWDDEAGMNSFLSSPGFAALTQAFGWPSVKTWSVLHERRQVQLAKAAWSTREIVPIAPYADLSALTTSEAALADQDVDGRGALAAVVAFDPAAWTLVRFRLWEAYRPDFAQAGVQAYQVGHMALPLRVS